MLALKTTMAYAGLVLAYFIFSEIHRSTESNPTKICEIFFLCT